MTSEPQLRRVVSPAEQWDIVLVPFPFSDQPGQKRRPALTVSQVAFNRDGATIFAMITTAGHRPWPGDSAITDLSTAGLTAPCLVRLKLFTLDNRLILKTIGRLGEVDRAEVSGQLRRFVPR